MMNRDDAEQRQKIENVSVVESQNVTFNQTQIIQISVDVVKTRSFNQFSPYKGLKKFEPTDKDQFFGRDQFLGGLVEELNQTNLILLLGASGSGKSSVVRAGLIPWLTRERGSQWINLMFTPDQNPFESLYASLRNHFSQADAQIAREAKADTLTQVVTTLRKPETHWLIFIDQFEELFTTSQVESREGFVASLVQLNTALKLLGQPNDCPVKIVATMRADFLDRLSPYPALVKATNQHRPLIAEMQRDELRLAIEQPAAQHGVVFEAGLVEEIIKDVQGQAGYLPLLQYTLNLLWEQESQSSVLSQERTLYSKTYRELGGVRGALQKHVDHIYSALPQSEQLAAQRIFLKLVEIGGDEESATEWKPVRRRANRSEFTDELEQRVLTRLINENLLVSDRQSESEESTVEIAHEVLLTSWETLNIWIKENRQAIALRNRLNDDVSRWQTKKQDDELWTGSKLEQVLELRKDPTFNQVLGGFSPIANQFVDASSGLRDRIRKRQIRQARTITGVSIGAAVLVGIAGVVAMIQRQEAVRQKIQADVQRQEAVKQKEQAELQRQEAETQKQRAEREKMEQYAANAEALLASEPTEGLVNAIAAVGLSRSLFPSQTTPESVQKSLFTSVQASREEKVIQIPGTRIQQVTFSSDGQSILTVSEGAIVNAWNLQETSFKELFRSSDLSEGVVISSDGQRFLNGSSDGILQLWNSAGEALGNPFKSPDRSRYAGVSSDGERIFSYVDDFDCVAIVWNSQDFEQLLLELYKFACGAESTDYHSFSYNGLWLVGGVTYRNSVIVVDLQDGLKKELTLPVNRITSATLSSDGRKLVVGDEKGGIYLWDLSIDEIMSSSSEQIPLQEDISNSGHADRVTSVAFSPDGQRIVSSSQDGTIRLWDTESLQPISEPMLIQKSVAKFVTFSSDGKHIVSRSEDGVVHLWDAQRNPTEQGLHDDINNVTKSRSGLTRLTSVAFSNDGQYILVKGNDNWAGLQERNLVFDLQGNSVSEEKQKEITDSVKLDSDSKLNFSPDGERIVSITSDSQNIQMHKVSLESWLEIGCNRLRYHPILIKAETDVAKEAKGTCEQYVWSTNKSSDSQISEAPATSAETMSSSTISQSPSTSTSAYTFEFPQDSCGDKSAPPDALWYPVFIDDKSVEEVSSQYCKDAQSVSDREKTGKPSVQVASFSDRNKAQAFAERVGGEVGEPHRLSDENQ